MFTDFLPLALTSVDWKTLQKFCPDATRGHDKAGIKLDDPASYPAALSFDNQPLENLRIKQVGFDHVFASFIGTMDDEVIFNLAKHTRIRFLKKGKLVIVTGSLSDWRDGILACCKLTVDYGIRAFMSDIYFYFYRTLFREMFYEMVVVEHTDKTVLIR